MQLRILFILIIISIFSIGCSTSPNQVFKPDNNLVTASYRIVDHLEDNMIAHLTYDDLIIVASFVDVSDLKKSTPFGRIMAEQIGSRFSQKGYKVIEMKLRQHSIFVDSENNGEFLLSRNLKDISLNHNASAVVVGTYTPAYDKVYVSTRIVDPNSSIILASYDHMIPFHYKDMNALIRNTKPY